MVCIGLRVRQLPAPSLPPTCTHNTRRGCLRGLHTAARPSTCHTRRGLRAHTREKVRLARGFQRPIREKVRPTLPLQQHFREKTRPASPKTSILGCFQRAGRTFSRSHPPSGRAGRTFSRTRHSHVATMKPTTPLQPQNAPQTPISHPQRRSRFQTTAHLASGIQLRRQQTPMRPSLRKLACNSIG